MADKTLMAGTFSEVTGHWRVGQKVNCLCTSF